MQLMEVGLILLFIGIVIIFIGILLSFREGEDGKSTKKEVKAGGVIFIGPIPIVFGTDKKMLIISIILALIMLVIFLVLFFNAI